MSGVYYVNVPKGSGRLMFEDPRGSIPPFGGRIVLDAEEGQMVLFPPWLQHHVGASCVASGEIRISLSFNILGKWTDTSDVSVILDGYL